MYAQSNANTIFIPKLYLVVILILLYKLWSNYSKLHLRFIDEMGHRYMYVQYNFFLNLRKTIHLALSLRSHKKIKLVIVLLVAQIRGGRAGVFFMTIKHYAAYCIYSSPEACKQVPVLLWRLPHNDCCDYECHEALRTMQYFSCASLHCYSWHRRKVCNFRVILGNKKRGNP